MRYEVEPNYPVKRILLILTASFASSVLFVSAANSAAVTFPVAGGENAKRRIVVSYDSSQKQFGPGTGPDVLLIDQSGNTIAEFPALKVDWSWSGDHPEQAIDRAVWNDAGDLVYIVYQAGRLYSGFDVYRFANGQLSPVDVDSLFLVIHEKNLLGPPPISPNVALSRVVAWLNPVILLCAMDRADGTHFLAVTLPKTGNPRLVHSFQLPDLDSSEP